MRIALAFSGGLDTLVSLKLLQERYQAEVITVTVSLGQPRKFDPELPEKLGATEHVEFDAREEFVEKYIHPCIKANGTYEGYHLSAALARYLIASKVVEVAKKKGADGVAHGCTGKGNDQFRFDITFSMLAPELKIFAPIRELNLDRKAEAEYARKKGIPLPAESTYSIDENLWGRTIEGGVLEDPSASPPEDVFAWTKISRPSKEELSIYFQEGVPRELNGERLGGVELITRLNQIGGAHGVGRIDIVEDRILGLKAREIYEAPAATILIAAHRALEQLTLTKGQLDLKSVLEREWAELVYRGFWFDPLKSNLDAFIDSTQKKVTGEVRIELGNGWFRTVGRKSPYSLYDRRIVSFETSDFDQRVSISLTKLYSILAKLHRG